MATGETIIAVRGFGGTSAMPEAVGCNFTIKFDWRRGLNNLVQKWRELSDENFVDETLADSMEMDSCVISHRVKGEIYKQCADELDAALKSMVPAQQHLTGDKSGPDVQTAMKKAELFDEWWDKNYVRLALGYMSRTDVRVGFMAALELVESQKQSTVK